MRLFIGLELAAAPRAQIAALACNLPGARWIDAHNLHLTLHFLGEIDPVAAEDIDLALSALHHPAFSVVLSGTGSFQRQGREAALWVGVQPEPLLDRLHARVGSMLRRAGQALPARGFHPHVTVARLNNPQIATLAEWMQRHNLFRAAPMAVDHISLFSSHRGGAQAEYAVEARYDLRL